MHELLGLIVGGMPIGHPGRDKYVTLEFWLTDTCLVASVMA